MEKAEVSLEMLVALGRLDERDREVVIERIVRGQTLQAVAEMLGGMSRTRVQQLERRGLRVLSFELRRLNYER